MQLPTDLYTPREQKQINETDHRHPASQVNLERLGRIFGHIGEYDNQNRRLISKVYASKPKRAGPLLKNWLFALAAGDLHLRDL